ncbi:MAG: adenylyltransferase/cytidyltransferase family protein [Tepidisphaeraceae bacterium]
MPTPDLSPVVSRIPYRMAFAGGWIDQPFVSKLNPDGVGSMVVVQIEPTVRFMDRCGMATGTRKVAQRLWGESIPDDRSPATLVRELYAEENKDLREPSGSQDMIGLIYPGISRLDYDFNHEGGYFPSHIETCRDEQAARWLEKVVHMIPVAPRPPGYGPLGEKRLTPQLVQRLGRSGRDCFDAIVRKDIRALGTSMNACMDCWATMLPHVVKHHTLEVDLVALLDAYCKIYPARCTPAAAADTYTSSLKSRCRGRSRCRSESECFDGGRAGARPARYEPRGQLMADSILVSESFHDLTTRHVRLVHEASKLGPVTVELWPDEVVRETEGRDGKFPIEERRYWWDSCRYVNSLANGASIEQSTRKPAAWVMTASSPLLSARRAWCEKNGVRCVTVDDSTLSTFPVPPACPIEPPTTSKRVIVTGCFDWFHTGHVRFFEEVAELGDLYVCVGHDANIRLLKGEGRPLFPEAERAFICGSMKFAAMALVTSGDGWMDAAPEIAKLKPHIYAVNEDGDKPDKREFCQTHGIEYVVLKRLPKPGLTRRSSTDLREGKS